jgi:4'-phosphopantetheinyl transferase
MSFATARMQPQPIAASGSGSWQGEPDGVYWRLVDLDNAMLERATDVLDRHERDRAARFRFSLDRSRYVAAHIALRVSLSEVLEQAPERIQIALGPQGKPMLSPDQGWVFNLSHSEGVALIAVAPSDRWAEIGADIEISRQLFDWQSLARENFSDAECEALAGCSDRDRSNAFLRCWTRKEACVKALGTGLTMPTKGFTIGVGAATAKVAIDVEGQSRCIQVRTLFETDTCVAAIAYCPRAVQGDAPNREGAGGSNFTPGLDRSKIILNGASPLNTRTLSWNRSLSCKAVTPA